MDTVAESAFARAAARVRFVLDRPSHPGNIGAAARALKTMGFSRLSVVNPRCLQFRSDPEAIALATNAVDVLQNAREHADLQGALDGVTWAWAMTGYAREFGPSVTPLREAAAQLPQQMMAEPFEVAFVFGTERSGLRNDAVERCQGCCAIPADPDNGSLNLAQAVQVAAYECRLALHAAPLAAGVFDAEPAAAVDAREAMYAHLEQGLIALGYLDPEAPRRLMSRLRRLLNRAQPSVTEIDILRGIAAAMVRPKRDRKGDRGLSHAQRADADPDR